MAAHPYNLRSRVNSPAALKTPGATPASKLLLNPSNKSQYASFSLRLDHVIGTTTKSPGGLSACTASNTFAYCAGSVAVLAQIDGAEIVSHRYYRARPAVIPVNPSTSYYTTPSSTPTRRRTALFTPKREQENVTPGRTLPEDENAKTWTARERIKTVRSVALSSNGKYLAVGETGYNPRVLLFSTAKDTSTETPLSIVTEHTWGVKCVAFSPDSRFLATLGDSNDGFLFIWHINPKTGALKLCATNKCTSNICHVTWCGQQLITVGTRHVKVWQLPGTEKSSPCKRSRLRDVMTASPSGAPTPLAGRNCLLGNLVDVTFTCVVAHSDRQAFICTDTGSICLLDVSKTPAELTELQHEARPAGAMGLREAPSRLVWAGGGGQLQEIGTDALLRHQTQPDGRGDPDPSSTTSRFPAPRRSALRQSLGLSLLHQTGTFALSCLGKHTICIDADSNLVVTRAEPTVDDPTLRPLSSHNDPVQGVQALNADAGLGAFLTWSRSGEVRFWGADAQLLRVEQIELDEGSDIADAASNELKVLRHCSKGFFLSGDRFGVLKITRSNKWELTHILRAHSAEVNDVCFDATSSFVATCSRDRMVQVFKVQDDSIELSQTTDDHIAAVNQVVFNHDGNSLLSCSSDRTIVVREKASRNHNGETVVAFLQVRIITIKAAPLSMRLMPGQSDILYVSALDRHITRVDYQTGTILDSFKVSDAESDDHAVLNVIQVTASLEAGMTRDLLIGCSSTDKSIRVYDLQKQSLISRESAHTEGISDLALLTDCGQDLLAKRAFVSTGHDSTIMLWTVIANGLPASTPGIESKCDQAILSPALDSTPAKASPAALPPLRKVLTKLDIAEFVKPLSPRSPSMRDPSPARGLRRKGSRLALAESAIEERDENIAPNLQRRSSTDDRVKTDRKSPSPPPYATQRQKQPLRRGEITKDFFTRQSEWLRKPLETDDTPTNGDRLEPKANKARLRRPPSVPTDLRAKALSQERRASTLPPPSEFGSINMASEQACRMLRSYKKKLQHAGHDIELDEVEEELQSTLEAVRKKKSSKKANMTEMKGSKEIVPPKLKRSVTSTSTFFGNRKMSISTTGSEANSPTSGSANSSSSEATERAHKPQKHAVAGGAGAGGGVEGLSHLLERTTLAGV